jgi:probable rRNA maturation factor
LIVIEPPSSGASAKGFPALRKPDLSRFLKRAQKAVGLDGEVTVLLADDARLKELNRTFRHKNKATDVLSFPAGDNAEGIAGDLAVSVETASRQAAEHGHSLEEELRILILHGVLHLSGHDHEKDNGEMRARESELRAALQLPAGLIERTLDLRGKLPAANNSTSGQKLAQRVRGSSTTTVPSKQRQLISARETKSVTTSKKSASEKVVSRKSATKKRPIR